MHARAANRPDAWAFGRAPGPAPLGALRASLEEALDGRACYVVAGDAPATKKRPDAGARSLLFELTMTVPRSFFDGRRDAADASEAKAKAKKRSDLGSDYESSDSDYGSDGDGRKTRKAKKKKKKKKKKGDSDDESPRRKKKHDSDDESPRRKTAASSDDDSSPERSSKKKKKKKKRADSDADSDEVYSDEESASSGDEKPKKRAKKRGGSPDKPKWFSKRMGRGDSHAKAAARDDSDGDKGPRRRRKRAAREGYVEVSCGWALVPLDRLRATRGALALDLKGGSPFHEEAISPDDVPRAGGGWFGSARKPPRLSLRVGPAPLRHGFLEEPGGPFPETCVVPAAHASLVSTYHRYLQDYLGRHVFHASSGNVADPVLALFRKLAATEASLLALAALWRRRLDERLAELKPGAADLTQERAAQAALQVAVCELWPLAESFHARNAPEDASNDALAAAAVLATPTPSLAHGSGAGDDRAAVLDDAARLLAPFLRDEEAPPGDGKRKRRDDALFAPFDVRELAPM